MTKKILILSFILLTIIKVNAADQPSTSQPQQPTTQNLSFIQHIEQWYKENTNYFSITALMAAESSILPVPSEMVIPPAVYVALEPDSITKETVSQLAAKSHFFQLWRDNYYASYFARLKTKLSVLKL